MKLKTPIAPLKKNEVRMSAAKKQPKVKRSPKRKCGK